MIDLVKYVVAKPLNGIVAALCVVVLTTHLGLFEVKQAMAIVQEQQKIDVAMNSQVLSMNESLIRIDENVKFMKDRLDHAYTETKANN